MTFNLLVCYRLGDTGRSHAPVLGAIEALGPAAAIYAAIHYVKSRLPAAEAVSRVWRVMGEGDSVFVMDATTGEAAWKNLDERIAQFLKESWRG